MGFLSICILIPFSICYLGESFFNKKFRFVRNFLMNENSEDVAREKFIQKYKQEFSEDPTLKILDFFHEKFQEARENAMSDFVKSAVDNALNRKSYDKEEIERDFKKEFRNRFAEEPNSKFVDKFVTDFSEKRHKRVTNYVDGYAADVSIKPFDKNSYLDDFKKDYKSRFYEDAGKNVIDYYIRKVESERKYKKYAFVNQYTLAIAPSGGRDTSKTLEEFQTAFRATFQEDADADLVNSFLARLRYLQDAIDKEKRERDNRNEN